MRTSFISAWHVFSTSRGTGFLTRDLLSDIRLPHRRTTRRFARKAAHAAVVVVMLASIIINDDVVYSATWRAIHEEERISLRPGMWAVAGDNLRQAATSFLRSLNGLLPAWFPPGAPQMMRPGGYPYGWQSADGPIPFTQVNLATTNTLTSVPVVGWGGLGRGIQFSLFRNAVDVADDLNTLPSGWTHSYSRRLSFAPGCDGSGGGGSGSQGFYGENQSSNAPEGEEGNAPEGGDVPAGSGSDVPSGTAFDAAPSSFGPEGGGGAPGVWLRTDDGRKIFFLDNGDNTYTAPPGIDLKLERIVGPSITYKLTDPRQNVDIFDQDGWLTSLKDSSNNTTTLAYGGGAMHRLQTITDPAGNVLQLKYCGSLGGKLTQIHAPPIIKGVTAVSRMFYVTYDVNGRLYRITKAVADNNPPNCDLPPPAVYWAEFGYTSEGLLSQVKDYNGNTTTIEYDEGVIYRVTHPPVIDYIANPQQPISTTRLYDFTFHPADPIINPCGFPSVATASVTDERGGVTEHIFDESGRLETMVDPLDRIVATLVWNDDNRLDSSTGPIPGSTTIYTYDAAGNTTEVEDANMHSVLMTYDGLNNLTSMTDPLGQTVAYEYTDSTNPTQVTRVDGVGTSDIDLSYGADPTKNLGQLLSLDSANYINQSFDYTQTDLLSGEKGGFLKQSSFGRVMGDTEPLNMTNATFERGPVGHALKSTAYEWESPVGLVEPGPVGSCSPVYDLDENVIQTCAAGGISECDAPAPGTRLTFLEYDGNRNILIVDQEMPFDGTMHTEYTYDAMDRVTMEDNSAASYIVSFQEHMHIDPKHTILRDYSDTTGRRRMTYQRLAYGGGDPPCESRPGITIEYFTDAAGRLTRIDRTDGGTTHTTTYAYNDSTVLPAIVETKPNGFVTEYYVDIVGQVRKVVHLQPAPGGGLTEVKAFVYARDARDRITQVDEFDNGLPGVTTLYTYGDGHLTTADLDPSSSVDPVKLYWYWLDPLHLQPGDPNRLVKEERVGRDRKEYWYDAGGNRLSMRESTWDVQEQAWEVQEITRYNYSRYIDYNEDSLTFDPDYVPAFCEPAPQWRLCTGEPTEDLAPQGNDPAGGYGRDQLISHKTYYPNEPTLLEYTVYIHYGPLQIGRLYRKVDVTNNYDGPSGPWLKTTTSFNYDSKNRTSAIHVQRYASDGDPGNSSSLGAFLEVYGYDWKGHRIARCFCDEPEDDFWVPPYCKATVETFDYDGSHVLVERNTEQLGDTEPGCDRFTSTFTWGPLGLITRVHERNDVDLGTNCHYHYLSDGRGSNVGYIPHDLTQVPTPGPVFFPMDAWGNLYDDLPVEYCPRDSGVELTKDFQGGKYQYHGSDGYQTDLLGPIYNPNQDDRGRSTGFIYIGARFYDPATGRFLQVDSVPIDTLPFAWGQNNKWTYAANDPLTYYDPTGTLAMTGTLTAVATVVTLFSLFGSLYLIDRGAKALTDATLPRPRCLTRKQCHNLYLWCIAGGGRDCLNGLWNCQNNGRWDQTRWPLPKKATPKREPRDDEYENPN